MNDQDTPPSSITVANPFGAISQTRSAEVERTASQSIAEVQAAMVIAQRFPRDPIQAAQRIINACTRQSLAEGALYSYSRGGTEITGPSIRLAEVCAQNWGNISFGIRELEQKDGVSTVEAYAWDVETNTKQVKVFQVPHIRSKKTGNVALTDSRDIYELVANQGARRLRSCILGVIPGDVIETAVEQCEQTLNSKADTTPAGLEKMLNAFSEFGITKEQIETRIQRKLDTIRPAQIVNLKKIYASIRDGMSEPGEWFPVAAGTDAAQSEATKPAFTKPAAKTPKPQANKQPPPQDQQANPPGATPPQQERETQPPADDGKGKHAPEQEKKPAPEKAPAEAPQQQEEKLDAMTELLLKMDDDAVRREEALAFARSKGSKATSFRALSTEEVGMILADWAGMIEFQKNPK